MTEEITKETIMMMGANAQLESTMFNKDTFGNLLKKYREIRSSSTFLEESINKVLQQQIEVTIEAIASRNTEIQMLGMMKMILESKPEK